MAKSEVRVAATDDLIRMRAAVVQAHDLSVAVVELIEQQRTQERTHPRTWVLSALKSRAERLRDILAAARKDTDDGNR